MEKKLKRFLLPLGAHLAPVPIFAHNEIQKNAMLKNENTLSWPFISRRGHVAALPQDVVLRGLAYMFLLLDQSQRSYVSPIIVNCNDKQINCSRLEKINPFVLKDILGWVNGECTNWLWLAKELNKLMEMQFRLLRGMAEQNSMEDMLSPTDVAPIRVKPQNIWLIKAPKGAINECKALAIPLLLLGTTVFPKSCLAFLYLNPESLPLIHLMESIASGLVIPQNKKKTKTFKNRKTA